MRGGAVVRARKAVVSNASAWDTLRLVPPQAQPQRVQKALEGWGRERAALPACRSFMHLHLGFDAAGGARKAVSMPDQRYLSSAKHLMRLRSRPCGV